MTDTTPAYFVVCGKRLSETPNEEYGRRARGPAEKAGLKPIAGGEVSGPKVEVLEGELPEGSTFLVVEKFPSMAACKEFYHSEEYQSAIPFRLGSVHLHFIAALDGISDAELAAFRTGNEE